MGSSINYITLISARLLDIWEQLTHTISKDVRTRLAIFSHLDFVNDSNKVSKIMELYLAPVEGGNYNTYGNPIRKSGQIKK